MQNTVIAVVVIVILAAGGWWYYATMQSEPAMEGGAMMDTMLEGGDMPDNGMVGGDAMVDDGTMMAGSVKEFDVIGTPFAFDVTSITVKKGDTVRINFTNAEGVHDWVVDEFTGGRTKILQSGQSETIEFVADKAGTFEYYCSVGTHRQMGMKGTLTVTN